VKGYGSMKVKCFDENTEWDLQAKINNFLSTLNGDIIDIKYEVAIAIHGDDQIYCFSAMVIYSEKE
jgi:hypothetical protein